jgi:diacylglycerol kinase family enzyme
MPMRISLFHNQRAGDATSFSWIRELIETSGHEIVRVFDREAAFGELIDERTELVVAAGGDGTVAAAARLLAGKSIPLAVLPLGTANNIAKTLHSEAPAEELVACWETATRRRLDVGVARGAWGERRFLEGVGIGLVPAAITSVHTKPFTAEDVPSKLERATIRYCQVLSHLEPKRSTVTIDGESRAGDFLLVEVLNIQSVGPNLVLSPDADPMDGFFSVVTATEDHREELTRYLRDLIEGREGLLSLPTVRARKVEIETVEDVHVDDDIVRFPLSTTTSVDIDAAAVEVLVCY